MIINRFLIKDHFTQIVYTKAFFSANHEILLPFKYNGDEQDLIFSAQSNDKLDLSKFF